MSYKWQTMISNIPWNKTTNKIGRNRVNKKITPFINHRDCSFTNLWISLDIQTQKVSGILWPECKIKAEMISKVNLCTSSLNDIRISIAVHASGANFIACCIYLNPLTTLVSIVRPCRERGINKRKTKKRANMGNDD